MPGWWRRENFKNCNNLISWLIFDIELQQNYDVKFQLIVMIHPNRLENNFIIAPDAQQAEIIELDWEQLEGIQGGSWLSKSLRKLEKWLKSLGSIKVNISI